MLNVRMHLWVTKAVIYFVTVGFLSVSYATELSDAKSIPKPILMLGLFCNSAKIVMKKRFESDQNAAPWHASDEIKNEINQILHSVDMNDSGYNKAVSDNALTSHEANFIKYTASHEADMWLRNISASCSIYLNDSKKYDTCLQDNNSEIYKCYRQIKDQIRLPEKEKSNNTE